MCATLIIIRRILTQLKERNALAVTYHARGVCIENDTVDIPYVVRK
jgi:hypothetical protein